MKFRCAKSVHGAELLTKIVGYVNLSNSVNFLGAAMPGFCVARLTNLPISGEAETRRSLLPDGPGRVE